MPRAASSHLVTRHELSRLATLWRKAGKRVVFTNGVFDLLHRGHLDILTKAKSFGDVLVVGLNSDESVRRLKGPGRPINRQRDRAALLLALRPVDYVCIFAEDTPLQLISALKPNVLVKGAEYGATAIVGADVVKASGGSVRRVRMRVGYSSTAQIQRAKRKR
jgi:D-beta-D-heptose 7-phosphate kinase/D-beta-D-heptose 1-phosphate adenosyltransferase